MYKAFSSFPKFYRIEILGKSELCLKIEFFKEKINEIITNFDDLVIGLKSDNLIWNNVILDNKCAKYIVTLITEFKHLQYLANTLSHNSLFSIIDTMHAREIRKLIVYNSQLCKILGNISDNNFILVDKIGGDHLRSLCHDLYDIVDVIKSSSIFNNYYLLKLGSDYTEKILENGILWFEALKLMPEKYKRDYFLHFSSTLPKSQIKNIDDIIEIIVELKISNCKSYDEIKELFNYFGNEYLKYRLHSLHDFKKIVSCIPENIQNSLIKEYFGVEFLQKLLPHTNIQFNKIDNLADFLTKHTELESQNAVNIIIKMIKRLNKDTYNSPYIFVFLLKRYISDAISYTGRVMENNVNLTIYSSIAKKIIQSHQELKLQDFKLTEIENTKFESNISSILNHAFCKEELDENSLFSTLLNVYFAFFPSGCEKLSNKIRSKLNPLDIIANMHINDLCLKLYNNNYNNHLAATSLIAIFNSNHKKYQKIILPVLLDDLINNYSCPRNYWADLFKIFSYFDANQIQKLADFFLSLHSIDVDTTTNRITILGYIAKNHKEYAQKIYMILIDEYIINKDWYFISFILPILDELIQFVFNEKNETYDKSTFLNLVLENLSNRFINTACHFLSKIGHIYPQALPLISSALGKQFLARICLLGSDIIFIMLTAKLLNIPLPLENLEKIQFDEKPVSILEYLDILTCAHEMFNYKPSFECIKRVDILQHHSIMRIKVKAINLLTHWNAPVTEGLNLVIKTASLNNTTLNLDKLCSLNNKYLNHHIDILMQMHENQLGNVIYARFI